jgi:excinuclease ABC subunit B
MQFNLHSAYQPTGDQPKAIAEIVRQVEQHKKHQTLLGVTGSGKTFTMANVIQQTQLPTLVIAHNKTLAGQLYQEFRDFFPENAVSYFVSYYDYYQPEAYIPTTDTYIEKESTINDEIDKLRLASTANLLTRPDCIIVASVSCIYNLGSPVEFGRYVLEIVEGEVISRETLMLQLANLQYQRSDAELARGTFRLRGDIIQLWPAYEDTALRIETLTNKIMRIDRIDPVTGSVIEIERKEQYERNLQSLDKARLGALETKPEITRQQRYVIYPAKHYMTNPKTTAQAIVEIERDLNERLAEFRAAGKMIEAYRLEQKVKYDLDMIRELGFVNGIENYSRYFDGRKPGDPPYSLIEYFHENARLFNKNGFLTIVDESHITLPQIRGMHNGDRARKQTLIDYGFRLPSALDNRPLTFPEFQSKMDTMLYVSATPNEWEISMSGNEVVEQLIRPTGLLDPSIELRPIDGQIEDLIIEIIARKKMGQRVLVTTLTKKKAEALTDYLNDPEKVKKLLLHRQQLDTQLAESDQSDKTIYQGDALPVDQMDIVKIEPQYFTRASLEKLDLRGVTARQLSEYFPKVAYLHSDVETLERSDILDDLRRGEYDVVVGINLLREGLDLPEVTLVAILDADKEGFLRSRTSLIQTIGRAARHETGHVIMYADKLTISMKAAIEETQRRRAAQHQYNVEHKITATTIFKPIRERMIAKKEEDEKNERDQKEKGQRKPQVIQLTKADAIDLANFDASGFTPDDAKKMATKVRRKMKQAADEMDFELAAALRDIVKELEQI